MNAHLDDIKWVHDQGSHKRRSTSRNQPIRHLQLIHAAHCASGACLCPVSMQPVHWMRVFYSRNRGDIVQSAQTRSINMAPTLWPTARSAVACASAQHCLQNAIQKAAAFVLQQQHRVEAGSRIVGSQPRGSAVPLSALTRSC
jgi:hypothetical protein